MENVIEVKSVSKEYKGFSLKDITFNIGQGKIVGLIGQNGNGKTTIIRCLLNLVLFHGKINIFGMDNVEYNSQIKERIGFVFSECPFDESLNACNIGTIMKSIYKKWSEQKYSEYLQKFAISRKQKIKEYSRGMQVKLMLAVALSHEAELLILDEPTSGLDPIFRKEILDELKKFVSNERNSVLFSTHITSDLEQIGDDIIFVSKGNIIFQGSIEKLYEQYGRNDGESVDSIDNIMSKILDRGLA